MRITLPSGTAAELAKPSAPSDFGLVIAPDIYGLRPLFDEMAARIAEEQGWTVCAVEPFPGPDLGPDVAVRFEAVAKKDDVASLNDLIQGASATGCERVGLIGFCMGGMYAFKAAGLGRFERVVSFYGMIRLPETWRGEGQAEPLDHLQKPGPSPVLAIIGSEDTYTPPPDVEQLEALPNVEVVRYDGAEHGFVHDPSRPAHRADDAADAWRRCFEFLRS
jgi:carboxymethylenebutenolidase